MYQYVFYLKFFNSDKIIKRVKTRNFVSYMWLHMPVVNGHCRLISLEAEK
jgi:hypothetical protein